MSRRQLSRVLPFLVILGAFALRLYRLGLQSLWYDETVSLLLARSDLAELTRHTAGDIHPPLYYYLLHFWGQLAGWSEFSAAFFSLFFGVLLVAAIYRVAREWLSPGVALAAALLATVSPYNLWYSQEVRMYTLGALLGLGSMFFFLRMLRAPRLLGRDLIAYVLLTAGGIYTLYYFVFLVGFEYLVLGTRVLRSRLAIRNSPSGPSTRRVGGKYEIRIASFILAQFLLLLLYLPWLGTAFRQATDPPVPPWRTFTALPNMLLESLSALLIGQSVSPITALPLVAAFVMLLAFVFWWGRTQRGPSLLLLGYTFVPLAEIYLLSLWKPLSHVRYVFTYSPGFYILLALVLVSVGDKLAQRRVIGRVGAGPAFVAGAIILIALISAYSLHNFWFDPQYAHDDLRSAVGEIAENWRPDDVILVDAGYAYPALTYYYPGPLGPIVRLSDYQPAPGDARAAPLVLTSGSIGGSPQLGWNDPRSDFYAATADATRTALDRVFQSHPRVWLLRIYDTVTDPDGIIRDYLAAHGQVIDDRGVSGESSARVQGMLTHKLDSLPPDAVMLDATLGGRVALLGYANSQPPRPGEVFDTVLYWQPLQSLNYNYQLSIQLLDSSGRLVGQPHDETPLGNALPTSRWRKEQVYPEPVRLAIPIALPAGRYTVIVKLYNLNSGEVLGEPIPVAALQVDEK